MNIHYENGVATAPETVVTAKMTPQAKRRLAQRLTAAFNQARARGDRYFYFNGDWYNTKKKGESDAYWAKHFKDNTTGGGSANVLTSVGGMWRGKQGVEGRYDDNGKWMTFSNNSNSGPVEARGNNHSNMRGYIKADLPTDEIITKSGTDRGLQTTNTRTGITVGSTPKLTKKNYSTTNNANWDAADFVDALMPTNAVVNLISKGWNKLTGGTYEPFISKSGFNPFGYAKDASNGNVLGLGLRGVDAYTTLGMPGVSSTIDELGTRFAPKMATPSAKSAYVTKRVTENGNVLPKWHLNALSGSKPVLDFGRRSIERSMAEGLPANAARWGNRALQNPNTGLTYFFRTPVASNSYDIAIDNAVTHAPTFGYTTNLLMQGLE